MGGLSQRGSGRSRGAVGGFDALDSFWGLTDALDPLWSRSDASLFRRREADRVKVIELLLGRVLIVSADARALGGRDRRRSLEVLSAGDRERLGTLSDARADGRADAFLTGRLLVQLGLDRLAGDHLAADRLAADHHAADLEMGSTLPDGVHAIRKRGTHLEGGEHGLAPVAPVAALEAVCSHCGSTSHGKPSIPGLPVLVSIAYAGSAVFVALASADDVGALGIDAEALRFHEDSAPAMPDRALSEPDQDPSPPAPSRDVFDPALDLERWTAVEAVLKADGRGLRVDPSFVRLASGEGHADREEHARISGDEASYRIHRSVVDRRFLVAVAARKPDRETSLASAPANEEAGSPSL
ncbi:MULTISPECIES: 4'-phosphopantetheinyl transferase family protein [unclassified Pseudoclavibacter]|uniref:4'-phosphopantetheinyl transferase family protein n=1 Tax=unclassified Pseudoclavibacter TaxID=2615177 RepID=UPI001BA8818C|nr:4'-phosphopantetheinyl transferase superfamily protein [Pseudoclavibacter sp. Marseille-Q4354]MBS3179609.1 4'-phosphopantetheinyl transferase superfamily protein [Pseudoclavibacter sp. Marseille-Q4354]